MKGVSFNEPIIGYRGWRPNDQRLQLLSSANDYAWIPGENRASCWGNTRHVAPHPGCHCGMNACSSLEELRELWGGTMPPVYGVVLGYDDIQIHPNGWRAYKAEIVALADNPLGQVWAPEYGVLAVKPDQLVLVAQLAGGMEIPSAIYKRAENWATHRQRAMRLWKATFPWMFVLAIILHSGSHEGAPLFWILVAWMLAVVGYATGLFVNDARGRRR